MIIKDKYVGNLDITENSKIKGMVVGRVNVKNKSTLIIGGMVCGSVEVGFGCSAIVNGTVTGDIINFGIAEINGVIDGKIIDTTGDTYISKDAIIKNK